MKKVYIVLIVLFTIFIYIFISSTSGYYEYSNNNKTVFTEEKIQEFEKDIAEGKNININNYLKNESKDYRNNITNLGDDLSEFINKTVNFILKGGFKIIEKIIN